MRSANKRDLISPEERDLQSRFHESLSGQFGRMPPLKNCSGYLWGEERQAEHANNIGPAVTLRTGDFAQCCLAAHHPVEPVVSACEQPDEIFIRRRRWLRPPEHNQLCFDTAPPEPHLYVNRNRAAALSVALGDRFLVQEPRG